MYGNIIMIGNLSKICRRLIGDLAKICRSLIGDLAKICRRLIGDLAKICRRLIGDLAKIFRRLIGDLAKICRKPIKRPIGDLWETYMPHQNNVFNETCLSVLSISPWWGSHGNALCSWKASSRPPIGLW